MGPAATPMSTTQVLVARDDHTDGATLTHFHHVPDVGGSADKVLLHYAGVCVANFFAGHIRLAVWCDLYSMSDRPIVFEWIIVARVILEEDLTGDVVVTTLGKIETLVVLSEIDASVHKRRALHVAASPSGDVFCGRE